VGTEPRGRTAGERSVVATNGSIAVSISTATQAGLPDPDGALSSQYTRRPEPTRLPPTGSGTISIRSSTCRLGCRRSITTGGPRPFGRGRETAGAVPLPGEEGDVDARGRRPGQEAVAGLRKCHETEALQRHHILPQSTDV